MTDAEIQDLGEVYGAYFGAIHHMYSASLRDFAREIERRTLERARQAVDAEHLEDEADNPSDAAYQCAVDDCVQAIGALMEQPK